MTAIRKNAMTLLEQMPEDKLYYIIQIMQGISGLYGTEEQASRDRAFEELESLRRKISASEYEKELEDYREEKYGTAPLGVFFFAPVFKERKFMKTVKGIPADGYVMAWVSRRLHGFRRVFAYSAKVAF